MGKKLGLLIISMFVASFASAGGKDPAASVKLLREKLLENGAAKIEGTYKIGDREVSNLMFGKVAIATNDNSIVDGIKDKVGGICTIFIKTGEDFIRASTNAMDKDGQRCMGTLLKNPGPVYTAIHDKNTSYRGEAEVCGYMYDTYYEPIKIGGKSVGIYFCGYRK